MTSELPGTDVEHAARYVGVPVTAATDKLISALMEEDGQLAIDFVRDGAPQRVYLDADSGRWLASVIKAWSEGRGTK